MSSNPGGEGHQRRALERLREGHLSGGIENILNDGDGQLCAVFAITDSIRNTPSLMQDQRIRDTSAQGLALTVYASIIRASERIRDEIGMGPGNRDTFSADQLQAGLDDWAQGLGLGGVTLGTVEHGRPDGRRVLLHSNDAANHTVWIGHHQTQGGATWRGIRGRDGGMAPEAIYTGVVGRIARMETLLAARGVRLADMTFGEVVAVVRANDVQMAFRVADAARRIREGRDGRPPASQRPPAENPAPPRLSLRALQDPQALVPGLPGTRGARPQSNRGQQSSRTQRGGRRQGGRQTRDGRSSQPNPANQGVQFIRRQNVDPREATEDLIRLLPVWTGPEGRAQLLYPGPLTPGRWSVLQFPDRQRLVPFFIHHGPQDYGAQSHLPDEVCFYYREVIIALIAPETDQVIVGYIRYILDTHNPRAQLTVQQLWRMVDPAQAIRDPHPLVVLAVVLLTRGTSNEQSINDRARGWGFGRLLERGVTLHVDNVGRLVTHDGEVLAATAFPEQMVERRSENSSSGRRVPDRRFIDQHESRETAHWNVPRMISQIPTPEQAQAWGSLSEGHPIRATWGDGYLRTPEIVARERSIRPFTHLNRDAESMQFAESNGVSTDSDVLDFDPPVQGEVDFYRDQRLDCQIIAQLVDQVPEPRRDIAREVLALARRIVGGVQSRMAMVQSLQSRELVYQGIAQLIAHAPHYALDRAFINTNNRELANAYVTPVILGAVVQLVGPIWETRLRGRIHGWISASSPLTINLRDALGRVRGERARVPAPERRQEAHEAWQHIQEARRLYLERVGTEDAGEAGPSRTVDLPAGRRRPRDESRSPSEAESRRQRLRREATEAGVILCDTPSVSPPPMDSRRDQQNPGRGSTEEEELCESEEPDVENRGGVDPDDLMAPWNPHRQYREVSESVEEDDENPEGDDESQQEEQDAAFRPRPEATFFPDGAPNLTNAELFQLMRQRFPGSDVYIDAIEDENIDGGDGAQDEDDDDVLGNLDGTTEEYMPRRERERSGTALFADDEPDAPVVSYRRATSVGPYSRHL